MKRLVLLGLTFLTMMANAAACAAGGGDEIRFVSSADGTKQPAMFFHPGGDQPVPMIVALHTWSGGYKQTLHKPIEKWCIANGWAYLHPDFRGPNNRPQATGSPLAIADIVSAVEHAKKTTKIDGEAIYLVGTSGGGHAALLMAGRHPRMWAGVSAWVAISDLEAWYHQCAKSGRRYAKDMVASCGGKPGDGKAVDAQYRARSPITYLAKAKGVRLHINAGIMDGHHGSVPISHSLRAFNEVAAKADRIAEADIRFLVEKARVPAHLQGEFADPTYGKKQPLFRKSSGSATVTIFNGGHELVPDAALGWLLATEQTRRKSKTER